MSSHVKPAAGHVEYTSNDAIVGRNYKGPPLEINILCFAVVFLCCLFVSHRGTMVTMYTQCIPLVVTIGYLGTVAAWDQTCPKRNVR